jgi:hypothetical protein
MSEEYKPSIKNLYCLCDRNYEHILLDLFNVKDSPVKLELDLEKGLWKGEDCWNKIGYSKGGGIVRFVFDLTNLDHVRNAFEANGDFFR